MTVAERIKLDLVRVREFVTAAIGMADAKDFCGADMAAREATAHLTEAIQLYANVVDEDQTLDDVV